MRPMHMNPEEAVAMHRDLRSRRSLAMHWGTFRLTDESPAEPPVFLRQVLAREGLPEGVFTAPRIGETVVLAD
jgi:N-acyl-phosphatidylethanolamine-hydrolysing phospholipase D